VFSQLVIVVVEWELPLIAVTILQDLLLDVGVLRKGGDILQTDKFRKVILSAKKIITTLSHQISRLDI
jgi:hypothetical protein